MDKSLRFRVAGNFGVGPRVPEDSQVRSRHYVKYDVNVTILKVRRLPKGGPWSDRCALERSVRWYGEIHPSYLFEGGPLKANTFGDNVYNADTLKYSVICIALTA